MILLCFIKIMRLQPYGYEPFCVTCSWGSEDKQPIILFTSTDAALWNSINIETKTKYHPLLKWVVWLLFILLIGKWLFQNSFTASEEVTENLPSVQHISLVHFSVCLCNSHSVKSFLFWSITDWKNDKS